MKRRKKRNELELYSIQQDYELKSLQIFFDNSKTLKQYNQNWWKHYFYKNLAKGHTSKDAYAIASETMKSKQFKRDERSLKHYLRTLNNQERQQRLYKKELKYNENLKKQGKRHRTKKQIQELFPTLDKSYMK